ncbi:MAG: glycerate kinase [Sutterella wadsworthensis]
MSARYLSAGDTAYVELAEAAGLRHRAGFSAANTTTFGAGGLIGEALNAGHRRIVITLGSGARRTRKAAWPCARRALHGAQRPQFHPNGRHARRHPPHRPQSVLL